MTEQKSKEIKIRVTPSFKARVQSAADAAGVSLTQWLEDASEEKMVSLLAPITARKGWEYISTDSTLARVAATMTSNAFDAALEAEVPPIPPRWNTESHPAKSWMHEGRTPERRTEPCPHSKPPYAFCAECDR